MKRSLVILFAILSLIIFFEIERGQVDVYSSEMVKELSVLDSEQGFFQDDNYINLNGSQGTSPSIPLAKLVSKGASFRGNIFDALSGVKFAVANLYSECSYLYSCNFPFEHKPQRELFFILRNIRI